MPDSICSDCGEKSCVVLKHWGRLVPEGEVGSFCGFCLEGRQRRYEKRLDPLPLGVQPPGIPEEFADQTLEVTTVNKAAYRLDLTEEKNERIVSQIEKSLPFTKARVMCLKIGKGLVLKPRDNYSLDLWFTPPVEGIKPVT